MVKESMIIESNIKVFRNIANYMFVNLIDKESSRLIVKKIEMIFKEKRGYAIKHLENNGIEQLKIQNKKRNVNILVNDEEHVTVCVKSNNFNFKEMKLATKKELNTIEDNLKFSFDVRFGYLTQNIFNVGLAEKYISILHIPLIELSGYIPSLKSTMSRLGYKLTRAYGNGKEINGGYYKVEFNASLGYTEKEAIDGFEKVIERLLDKEMKLRTELLKREKEQVEDEVNRAYGILTNAKLISESESMILLSYLKLGIDLGLVDKKIETLDIRKLILDTKVAELKKASNSNVVGINIDAIRANYIKNELLMQGGK